MKEYSGNPEFPIWLLGDSPPINWADILEVPFDPRHPIRHNIWTSVLDVIQSEIYKTRKCRLNSEDIYIRNAILNASY
jgi:hypothetical protein